MLRRRELHPIFGGRPDGAPLESSAARRRRSLWPQGRTRFTSTAITCSPRIWPQGSRAGFQVNSVEVGSSRRFPRWTNRTAPLGRTLRVPISSPSRGAGRIRVLDVGPAEGSRRWAHPGRTPQDEVLPSLHEAQLVDRVDRLPLNRSLEAEVEVRGRRFASTLLGRFVAGDGNALDSGQDAPAVRHSRSRSNRPPGRSATPSSPGRSIRPPPERSAHRNPEPKGGRHEGTRSGRWRPRGGRGRDRHGVSSDVCNVQWPLTFRSPITSMSTDGWPHGNRKSAAATPGG